MAREPEWITEAREALDAMERHPPSEKELAPFRTKTWIAKGEGMLVGLKPIAVVVLLALGGCTEGWLESFASAAGDHSTTFVGGRAITTYHYPPPDSRHSVERLRPDIWFRMFKGPRPRSEAPR